MISIIIPAYNVEKYIGPCIESALSQSFRDIEVIVVNDGSTDSTPVVIQEFERSDSRVRVVNRENGGQSVARNTALDIARGDWITFLDGDDMLLPGALEILINEAVKTNADLVSGSFVRNLNETKNGKRSIELSPEEALLDILYQKYIQPSPWGKLYKKFLFDNLRFRKSILYEDLDLIYRIVAQTNKVIYTDTPVYFYRVTPGSSLNSFSKSRFDVLDVTERLEQWAASTSSSEVLKAARDRRLSANFNILGLIAANKKKEYENVARSCWDIIKRYRFDSLVNPKVRLKNKAGIMLSYLGYRFASAALGRFY